MTIIEVPDDDTASALLLAAGSLGNVRTETLRAYTAREIASILKRV
ncbi:MAG TPA: GYD domain-containing protein [Candidatus Methylomirabilis sp.]|nr:GYD domain-containing protein [Candidatus Methylomirabilis sp.]